MKKTHNERGAGRNPKFNVPTKLIRVPEPIIEQVTELSQDYKYNSQKVKKEHKKYLRFNKL